MLDDYLKTNPGVKDLPRPGIEPQSPSPQPKATTAPHEQVKNLKSNSKLSKFDIFFKNHELIKCFKI